MSSFSVTGHIYKDDERIEVTVEGYYDGRYFTQTMMEPAEYPDCIIESIYDSENNTYEEEDLVDIDEVYEAAVEQYFDRDYDE